MSHYYPITPSKYFPAISISPTDELISSTKKQKFSEIKPSFQQDSQNLDSVKCFNKLEDRVFFPNAVNEHKGRIKGKTGFSSTNLSQGVPMGTSNREAKKISWQDMKPTNANEPIVKYAEKFVKVSQKRIHRDSLTKRASVQLEPKESGLIKYSQDSQSTVRREQRSNSAASQDFKCNIEETGCNDGNDSNAKKFGSPNSKSQKTNKRMLAPDKSDALQAWKNNFKRGPNPPGITFSSTAPFGSPNRN
jgi:hypothetical protein